MITSKVKKNRAFDISLKNTVLEKLEWAPQPLYD